MGAIVGVRRYNRDAWNSEVEKKCQWTVPVSSKDIGRARQGDWEVVLTPQKPVPRDWFPPLEGCDVLGLASAGGQQCPLFAAAGANVTVYDNSPAQLAQDRSVAERDGLDLRLIEGDMADLSVFGDDSFDLVFHACSNCFVPDILPVWSEAFRVLRPGGSLLAGFVNPLAFIFDVKESERGELVVRHKIPYSDITDLRDDERAELMEAKEPMGFGHSLDDQIGGQIAAGFLINGFFEDTWPVKEDPLSKYISAFGATRALKPA